MMSTYALVGAEGARIALKLTEGQARNGRSANEFVAAVSAG